MTGDPFALHLQLHYRLTPDQVELADSPGYWRKLEPCGTGCRNELHGCVGFAKPIRHTVSYFDPPRDAAGRFASPYRTWRAQKAAAQ